MDKSKPKGTPIFLIALISLLLGFAGGYAGSRLDAELQNSSSQPQIQEVVVSEQDDRVVDISERVGPSVVSIVTTTEEQSFFGSFEGEGSGTGIIISSDGIVMTNRHVIPDQTIGIEVTLSDGTTYSDVELIGRDPRGGVDLAFLKINDVSGLPPATIGDSDSLRVGESVIAIGNALGEFQNSVTTGIISGVSRPIIASDGLSGESLTNLLQTDAAINPGNSGGPLLNLEGEVVGINTAVAQAENIGFAISISDITGIIDGVLATGELKVPYIGVRFQTINEAVAEQQELSVDYGALVRGGTGFPAVVEDSPAAKAGLQDQDIILEIDGTRISEDNQLTVVIGRKQVGDNLQLLVLRDGEEIRLEVVLEAAPESF